MNKIGDKIAKYCFEADGNKLATYINNETIGMNMDWQKQLAAEAKTW